MIELTVEEIEERINIIEPDTDEHVTIMGIEDELLSKGQLLTALRHLFQESQKEKERYRSYIGNMREMDEARANFRGE